MKERLKREVEAAVAAMTRAGELPGKTSPAVTIERSRDPRHGDFACPVALGLARAAGTSPRELASRLAAHLPESELVERVEIAGPGFINFYLAPGALQDLVREILEADAGYGRSRAAEGKAIQVEFVSANPTGPLHVGHGRGAAYGAVVANLLEAAGARVQREYYVNDAGRQMDILALSVWMRYLQRLGEKVLLPPNGYQGEYVREIAGELHRRHGPAFRVPAEAVAREDAGPEAADPEAHLDGLIRVAKRRLGETGFRTIFDAALDSMVEEIRDDLDQFGVTYDNWFSEASLAASGAIERAIARLREAGHIYEKDGAEWFRSTDFGDEKDRVVIRENGEGTYFASDIAYHVDKLERGFERIIDVWGADHHGYIARVKGALEALGEDPARLDVLLVQFANLYRGQDKLSMSTRAGEFVTLRELREEVGNDAARFFYVTRKNDQHLDFDLELAKSKSNENPVYYVQYAHARISSVMAQLEEKGYAWDPGRAKAAANRLTEPQELALLRTLSRYPEVIESAALAYEPHLLAFYLRELANDFHTYYNAHTFLVESPELRDARIGLTSATRIVIRNGLALLGVSAPESM